MVQNEYFWIGELVEISSFDSITIQLYKSDFNMIKNPFISLYKDKNEIIYCVTQIFEDSIDKSRKAIALNLSDEELRIEHPEHTYLIKPYISAVLVGTFNESSFTSGVKMFNVGLHNRLAITQSETILKLYQNKYTFSSLLSYVVNHPFLKLQLKLICSLWIKQKENSETKNVLLRNLSYLLRDDYFLLKEISDYLDEQQKNNE
jgi:hypothetical protein